ncbi:NADH-quinone oxidoreductase subunit NuoG [Motiliproteus sp. SC1-56]|uniref:NADH-quinone oxidoreductase subunit NuoG n=1 Tax=Motiliproteus sp. SC1-56 TaxID=2799565 RepID=UPI001A8CB12A|nr:NADH-quinone oxidoreductase subunit NuoG [Motiliproteus sp. SC1-56]
MPRIRIDGQAYEVKEGLNLLQACLGLGLNLPYFCWHPALGSVGACRQCALLQYRDEEDRQGRLVMGCMTAVADGQILSLKADKARHFRAGVIEALMTNHPHDCPVCEEGGECHLQDMTVMSGHHHRRYRGRKRTFVNQDLGPFINHEMNRCITCYRCLRFYRDYAGGEDLHALASRNHTYFGRASDGPLESEFAGNLVEVCPTGVFTDKPLSQSYTRKWDLQHAPSICVHCSLGCNISPGERYGRLKRVQNRYHHGINGYFLCDRGRFGFGHVNHPERPQQPLVRENGRLRPVAASEGLAELARRLETTERWIGIGSPRATLESNLALRELVGADHFFTGLGSHPNALNRALLELLRLPGVNTPSLREIEACDALLLLGEDITQSAPRMALSVRQAVRGAGRDRAAALNIPPWQAQSVQIAGQNARHPLFISHVTATRLDPIAEATYRASPQEQAALAFAVAHCLCPEAPAPEGLDEQAQSLAEKIAEALLHAKRPLIVTGPSSGALPLVEAAGQVARALLNARPAEACPPALIPVFAECNSLGLTLLTQDAAEADLEQAFALSEHGPVGAIILENDLFRRAPGPLVQGFLERLTQRIVIDSIPSPTLNAADLVLPATSFAESQGTLINNEGRAQPLFPVHALHAERRNSWQWLAAVAGHRALKGFASPADALATCVTAAPELAPLSQALPSAAHPFTRLAVPRMPHRNSGRTAAGANLDVREDQQPQDHDSCLTFSMEGAPAPWLSRQSGIGARLPFSWYPGWNSNQAVHKFKDAVDGPLRGGESGMRLDLVCRDNGWHRPLPVDTEAQGLLAVVQPAIFGGEELSNLAAPVFQRAALPCLRIHPDDAPAWSVADGDRVLVRGASAATELPLRVDPRVARGIALLPPTCPPLGTGPTRVSLRSLGSDPLIATDHPEPTDG